MKNQNTQYVENSIVGDYAQVNWLDPELSFLSDSQDVNDIKKYLGYVSNPRTGKGIALDFHSFFVGQEDGDYTQIWGMSGIIPYNNKEVVRLK